MVHEREGLEVQIKTMEDEKTIRVQASGPGIILYSPYAVAHISEGEDYLTTHYMNEQEVQEHIQQGTLVGFGTGSPGDFIIHIRHGYPDEQTLQDADCKLRLGIHVQDHTVCIRDLFDLMDWTAECPPEQQFELEDGYYHITLHSNRPESGILGDNQIIWMYFNKLPSMPALSTQGVPTLCL
ncbi:MAG: hypothetical protein WBP93_23765 [Pyrinomonadaceae bacterium]